jgi:hypothetical protein
MVREVLRSRDHITFYITWFLFLPRKNGRWCPTSDAAHDLVSSLNGRLAPSCLEELATRTSDQSILGPVKNSLSGSCQARVPNVGSNITTGPAGPLASRCRDVYLGESAVERHSLWLCAALGNNQAHRRMEGSLLETTVITNPNSPADLGGRSDQGFRGLAPVREWPARRAFAAPGSGTRGSSRTEKSQERAGQIIAHTSSSPGPKIPRSHD